MASCNCGGTAKAKKVAPRKVTARGVSPRRAQPASVNIPRGQDAQSTAKGTPKPNPLPNPNPTPKPNPCFCNGGTRVAPPDDYTRDLNARMDAIVRQASRLS